MEGNAPNLAQRIRVKLDAGTLPIDDPEKTYGGFGDGRRPCDGCDERIGRGQVEYEKVYADGRAFLFHIGCAGLWEAERRRRQLAILPPRQAPARSNVCAICGQRFAIDDFTLYRPFPGANCVRPRPRVVFGCAT